MLFAALPAVTITRLTGVRPPHIFLLHNTQVSNFGQAQGQHLCQRVFTLLQCRNRLKIHCHAIAQFEQAKEVKRSPTFIKAQQMQPALVPKGKLTQNKSPPETHARRPKLRSIPNSVCSKGAYVALVAECQAGRPREEWRVENDGYYKCRTETHWVSGCRRMLRSN